MKLMRESLLMTENDGQKNFHALYSFSGAAQVLGASSLNPTLYKAGYGPVECRYHCGGWSEG